jgi:hypothetical protein
MKDKKKFKVTEHSDGSTTYSPTSGVGFYTPFCLLKKDFKFPTELPESMRSVILVLKILSNIDQNNRLTTSAIQIGAIEMGMKKTAVNSFINNLVDLSILIKISRGLYKVSEELVLFKQDHEGYRALQKETQNITTNNIVNNTNNIIVQDKQSLKDLLIAQYSERLKLEDI